MSAVVATHEQKLRVRACRKLMREAATFKEGAEALCALVSEIPADEDHEWFMRKLVFPTLQTVAQVWIGPASEGTAVADALPSLFENLSQDPVSRWLSHNQRGNLNAWRRAVGLVPIDVTDSKRPRAPEDPLPGPDPESMPPDTAITADPLPRLRRAEAVLQRRTRRFLVVLEDCLDPHNVAAILRTCEGLGVQHVWIIGDDAVHSSTSVTMGADRWLTVRRFTTTADCVAALREAGRALWVTALSPTAACLGVDPLPIPSSVAVVFGREIDGASDAMLAAADRLVYLPMHGFAESFNVGIAAALVLQRLLSLCPEAEGDLPEEERHALRQKWYPALLRGRSGVDLEPFLARPPSPLPDLRRGTSWHYAKVGRLARRTEDLPPPPADPTDCVAKESLQSPCSPNAS